VDGQVTVLDQVQGVGRVTLVTDHLVASERPTAGKCEERLAIIRPQRFQQPPHAASQTQRSGEGWARSCDVRSRSEYITLPGCGSLTLVSHAKE
jgi:hypothetical protein